MLSLTLFFILALKLQHFGLLLTGAYLCLALHAECANHLETESAEVGSGPANTRKLPRTYARLIVDALSEIPVAAARNWGRSQQVLAKIMTVCVCAISCVALNAVASVFRCCFILTVLTGFRRSRIILFSNIPSVLSPEALSKVRCKSASAPI